MQEKNKMKNLLLLFFTFVIITSTFAQNNLIPNTLDCSSSRPPFAFDIAKSWEVNGVSNFATPLTGDIDGDGEIEILVTNTAGTAIMILDGKTGAQVGTINTGKLSNYATNTFAICDIEGDGLAEIFVTNSTNSQALLYEITSASGVRPITFKVRWTLSNLNMLKSNSSHGAIPFVADLDGDGYPEFLADRYVIDRFGNLKATLNFSGGLLGTSDVMSVPYAADLDGDGIPEIVVGTDIYKYNGTTATLWRRCPSFPSGQEGTNMAVDINLDGVVDLVYHDTRNKGTGTMVIWTPSTNTVIGTITGLRSGYRCYPVIGDIDGVIESNGNKYPEICFNAQQYLYCYKFNGSTFTQKWALPTNENSGVATFTFFDFNLDGIVELVYRDEQNLHIYDCRGSFPVEVYRMPATSATVIETPIVADVTGDGSANIIVTGSSKLFVFEGKESKWASCPSVWNQQMYSPLLINTDLTIISKVESAAWNGQDCNNLYPRYYNGGPMQVPFISEDNFCPIDVSPDIYVISGEINISGTTATITVTIGNQGLALAPSSTPIQFYKNSIDPANRLSSAATTLGVDLPVGQTHTITRTITGLSPMPTQFYVRLLDDGVNFPASGAYSDCNLTNNTKSFGTLELKKTANSLSACVDGTSIFSVELINNSAQTSYPVTYSNITLIDSLGMGWDFISATPSLGTVGAYDPLTHYIEWKVSSLNAGDTAKLIVVAKAHTAGANRNTVWVESVDNNILGREAIEAWVIVASQEAPAAATISPANPNLCNGSATLTASVSGADSYQWYRNNIEIVGAVQQTYVAPLSGDYTVTYFNGTCVSQLSAAVTVTENCIEAHPDAGAVISGNALTVDVLANDIFPGCTTSNVTVTLSGQVIPQFGTGSIVSNRLNYTAGIGKSGIDSLRYILESCNITDKDSAMVYIAVLNPLSKNYTACNGAEITLGFTPINGVSFYWYTQQTGGTIVSGGSNTNSLTITKGSANDISTWWVEARFKNITFNRVRVDLKSSANCGTTNPVGCAADGTIIWKEDFGGNSVSDPQRAPGNASDHPLMGKTTYDYVSRTNYILPAPNQYALIKNIKGYTDQYWSHSYLDDHTSWGNQDEGYFLTFDADSSPGQFYEFEIDELCSGSELTFSAWLMNINPPSYPQLPSITNYLHPIVSFIIEDDSGNVLATFSTGEIPVTQEPQWLNYSFDFEVPVGVDKVKVRFINNQESGGTQGNDISIDDIEVRFCAPEVLIIKPEKSDTTACYNTLFEFKGNYTDDGTFGSDLVYRWEFSQTGNINNPSDWVILSGSIGTVSTGYVESVFAINNLELSDAGYYRLVVGNIATINQYNCRAMSQIIHLDVTETRSVYPDIRVQSCTDIGTINLMKYIDTIDAEWIKWETLTGPPIAEITGTINTSLLQFPQTYLYQYQIKNWCHTASAKLYVKTINNNTIGLPPDTVRVCYEEAENLLINKIMGIDAGGTIELGAISVADGTYLEINSHGGVLYNGKDAYINLGTNGYYPSHSALPADAVRIVNFIYKPFGTGCINDEKTLVVILTDKID